MSSSISSIDGKRRLQTKYLYIANKKNSFKMHQVQLFMTNSKYNTIPLTIKSNTLINDSLIHGKCNVNEYIDQGYVIHKQGSY